MALGTFASIQYYSLLNTIQMSERLNYFSNLRSTLCFFPLPNHFIQARLFCSREKKKFPHILQKLKKFYWHNYSSMSQIWGAGGKGRKVLKYTHVLILTASPCIETGLKIEIITKGNMASNRTFYFFSVCNSKIKKGYIYISHD